MSRRASDCRSASPGRRSPARGSSAAWVLWPRTRARAKRRKWGTSFPISSAPPGIRSIRIQCKSYEVLTNLAQSSAKAHRIEASFSKF